MPTLCTMPGTRSLAANIAVARLDAPLEIHSLPYGVQDKDYLAIDPKGQVPAVRLEDGDVPMEAAAVLARVGGSYGHHGFARDTRLGRKEAEALSCLTASKPYRARMEAPEGVRQALARQGMEAIG